MARAALAGLRAYQEAPPAPRPHLAPIVAEAGGAQLRDHGGEGPPVVLIPSLINPPRILDLDRETSLAGAVVAMERRVLLLDWGPASARRDLDVAAHVEQLLLPLLHRIGQPPVLIGYCLGGTIAIAASNLVDTRGLITLAAPWDFSAYPEASRAALEEMWARAEPSAASLGLLPIEVLQAAFWSLDPERTVRKFAYFGSLHPGSAEARRFVALEEWANEGEPLPYPAARELIESLFRGNLTGQGRWLAGGIPNGLPTLHLTAREDRIAPAATAPPGPSHMIDAGHVGMVVGSARAQLHAKIQRFLALDH
jgi:polyhydroxyalkanoate synthase